MTDDSKRTRGSGLDTVVDDPPTDDGLETALSTLFVSDDERTVVPRADAGGTTTVIVPDDPEPPRSARGWMEHPLVMGAALGAVVLAVLVGCVALFFVVRAVSTEAAPEEGAAAPAAPAAPEPAAEPAPGEPGAVTEAAEASAAPVAEPEPLRATARCTFEPAYGGYGSLTIACDITNTRPSAVRATVVPVVYRGGVPDRVHREELALAPGERILRRYELRGRSEADVGSGCACEVTAAP